MLKIKAAPPNSLVFVEDLAGADPPVISGTFDVLSTPSCIAVACLCEIDGETVFILGSSSKVDPGFRSVFEGVLSTPTRNIVIRTSLDETLLEMPVDGENTVVRIWLHDPPEPDVVIVGVA